MAITSYQFRNQPYWLGFVFAGQAFTVSYRDIIPAGKTLNIQITTGKETITHVTNRTIVNQGEPLGIKLIKSPKFTPGRRQLPVINMDDRSRIQAATSFYAYATGVNGGTILEENMIPRYVYTQAGSPIESTLYERILQYNTNYILSITNEGINHTNVLVSMAFYESGN